MASEHGKHLRRRRRKAGAAAAAGSLLLVSAVTSGDTLAWAAASAPQQAPRPAPADPGTVSADGSSSGDTSVGAELLSQVGDLSALADTAPAGTLPNGPVGLPGVALQAYMRAAELMKTTTPGCHLSWPLLAGIGRIESGHARGGQVDASGRTLSPILGPVLSGNGFAAIADTDGGRYDFDARWDRAVGPMQFIPSTWVGYASDGNADGVTDPSNIYDAAFAAGKYLCSGGLDLSDPQQQAVAVFRYNHSDDYVRTVLLWANAYASGVTPLPMSQVPADVVDQAVYPVNPGSGRSDSPTTSSRPSRPTTTTVIGGPTSTTTPPSSTTTTPPTSCSTPPSSTTTPPSSSSPAAQSSSSNSSSSPSGSTSGSTEGSTSGSTQGSTTASTEQASSTTTTTTAPTTTTTTPSC